MRLLFKEERREKPAVLTLIFVHLFPARKLLTIYN